MHTLFFLLFLENISSFQLSLKLLINSSFINKLEFMSACLKMSQIEFLGSITLNYSNLTSNLMGG